MMTEFIGKIPVRAICQACDARWQQLLQEEMESCLAYKALMRGGKKGSGGIS